LAILHDERKPRIADIICEILEIEPAELTDTSLFKEDHNADSLRAIEILAILEREYAIEIDQSELAVMVNLDAVCAVVAQHAN
jgi:acyl carrier protein